MSIPNARNIELRLKQFAAYYGMELNPNDRQREAVISGLIKNIVKHGLPYCPCSILRNDANICPCDNLHEDVRKNGMCRCRLFRIKIADPGEDETGESELGFC
jgi:ferredoxin-thioredoxin reductase catalytic subunit